MADKVNMQIIYERCINCNLCIKACPAGVFRLEDNFMVIDGQNRKYCLNCNDCIAVCPRDAIFKDNVADIGVEGNVLSKDFNCSPEQFINFLMNIRPAHRFAPDPLGKEEQDYLFQVASLAPRNGIRDEARNTGIILVGNKELLGEIEQYTHNYLILLKKSIASVWQNIPNLFNRTLRRNIKATLAQIKLTLDAYQHQINLLTFGCPNLLILHSLRSDSDAGANLTIMGYQLTLGAESINLGLAPLPWVSLALQPAMIKKTPELQTIYRKLAIPKEREIQGVWAIGKRLVGYRKLKEPSSDVTKFTIL